MTTIPAICMYFSSYDFIKYYLMNSTVKKSILNFNLYLLIKFCRNHLDLTYILSGFFAEMCSSIIYSPLEVIK